MINMIKERLETLSTDALKIIYKLLVEENIELKRKVEKSQEEIIKEEVLKRGFSCQPYFSNNIPGLSSSTLYVNVDARSTVESDFFEYTIDRMSSSQPSWVNVLGFSYKPGSDDIAEIPSKVFWSPNSYDIITAVAQAPINIYHRPMTFREALSSLGEKKSILIDSRDSTVYVAEAKYDVIALKHLLGGALRDLHEDDWSDSYILLPPKMSSK